jgi:GTP cyclohydrolase IA
MGPVVAVSNQAAEVDGAEVDGAGMDGAGLDGAGGPAARPVDVPRIERAVLEILEAIGEDAGRDGLIDTPNRVARMYAEIFSGLREDPGRHLSVTFEEQHDEMVMVKDIDVFSVCEHHLVPWFGHAHVAYIPGHEGRITGLSKLARLVEGFARRPQVQERLTTQVADAVEEVLVPRGVLVVVEAEHLCMSMRGVRKPGAKTITSAVRGVFRDSVATRSEAMGFLRGSG